MASKWVGRMARVCSWATLAETHWIPHSVGDPVKKTEQRTSCGICTHTDMHILQTSPSTHNIQMHEHI